MEKLLKFIEKSPNAWFAVKNITELLQAQGYQTCSHGDEAPLKSGGKYMVTKNGSALIAFQLPRGKAASFHIMASHSDSPAFKIKPNAEIVFESRYVKLNTEKYGGMILSTWLDRPLSVAGRIAVRKKNGLSMELVNIDRDLLVIPSLAIHMDRKLNEGYAYNAQNDLLPLFGTAGKEQGFLTLLSEAAGVTPEAILETDLFLYNRDKGTLFGAEKEFLGSPRLDDLQCAYASLQGFLAAKPKDAVSVYCIMDNEEVGSTSKQGAAGTFLIDTLRLIARGLGRDEAGYQSMLSGSFLISADNAHAVHPNHPEKADPSNRPYLNGGIVIKYNANQKYTTDAMSAGICRLLCEKAAVPYQVFTNRSDIPGGSTLGNIASTHLSIPMVDIGLPQLAMHSAFETAGAEDTVSLIKLAETFYSASLTIKEERTVTLT